MSRPPWYFWYYFHLVQNISSSSLLFYLFFSFFFFGCRNILSSLSWVLALYKIDWNLCLRSLEMVAHGRTRYSWKGVGAVWQSFGRSATSEQWLTSLGKWRIPTRKPSFQQPGCLLHCFPRHLSEGLSKWRRNRQKS